MQSIPLIQHAWELYKQDVPVSDIADIVDRHRSTVYRWINGIKLHGIRSFLRKYKAAKKGRGQPRKTHGYVKKLVYKIRKKYNDCCGEKIKYYLRKFHDVEISVSTIYRILKEKWQLRSKWKKNKKRGEAPKAHSPREVIQVDTVDFGEVYAHTAIDIYTREVYVVMTPTLKSTDAAKALKKQMNYFGTAEIIQRDGGSEFKNVWEKEAKKYCSKVRTARPYRKNEQSYIESFNRTLRKECLKWRKYKKKDLPKLQNKVNEFMDFYHNIRPHLSLNMKTPLEYLSHLR